MKPVHVVYTDMRPIPLQHYIFPAGGDGLHLVVNEKGQFRVRTRDKVVRTVLTVRTDLDDGVEVIKQKNHELKCPWHFNS